MINEINCRKSIRQYKEIPISEEHMKLVKEVINDVQLLHKNTSDSLTEVKIINRGEKFDKVFILPYFGIVKSPHYMLFTSEKNEESYENIGFIGEQIVLKLTELGIGTCWIGMPLKQKEIVKMFDLKDNTFPIILIAFGYPSEEIKPVNERKRKKMHEIFSGKMHKKYKSIAQALQAAPSAMNKQPWKVIIKNDEWHYYIKKKNGVIKDINNKLNKINAGIGLSHILVEGAKTGNVVKFKKLKTEDNLEGYDYITTINFQ